MTPQAHFSSTNSAIAAAFMLALPGDFLLRSWVRSARNAALGRIPDGAHIDRSRGEGVFEGNVVHALDAAGRTLPWYRRKLVERGGGRLADHR